MVKVPLTCPVAFKNKENIKTGCREKLSLFSYFFFAVSIRSQHKYRIWIQYFLTLPPGRNVPPFISMGVFV